MTHQGRAVELPINKVEPPALSRARRIESATPYEHTALGPYKAVAVGHLAKPLPLRPPRRCVHLA